MKYARELIVMLLIGLGLSSGSCYAQSLKVVVLDALSGKSQADVSVEYMCAGHQQNSALQRAKTGIDGWITFANPCRSDEEIEMLLSAPDRKAQCGVGRVSLRDIIATGFVAQPESPGGIWCPSKISKTVRPVPGQVVLFIKSRHGGSHISPGRRTCARLFQRCRRSTRAA